MTEKEEMKGFLVKELAKLLMANDNTLSIEQALTLVLWTMPQSFTIKALDMCSRSCKPSCKREKWDRTNAQTFVYYTCFAGERLTFRPIVHAFWCF